MNEKAKTTNNESFLKRSNLIKYCCSCFKHYVMLSLISSLDFKPLFVPIDENLESFSNQRFRPRTHGNVFLRFCTVSSNELVVLDSLENSKQYKNAGKRFRVYRASKYLKELSHLLFTACMGRYFYYLYCFPTFSLASVMFVIFCRIFEFK